MKLFGKRPVLTPTHPSWELFIKFHTGQLTGVARDAAKALLFPIHYGSTDTTAAFEEVERLRKEASDGPLHSDRTGSPRQP